MIIDDEPWARKVVRKLGQWDRLKLEIIGEASDGIEGLELIKKVKPHIVITDMRMPGLDGVALLKEIYEVMDDTMTIAMSGYNDFIYLKQAIKSDAVDYLLKPMNPDELNEALEKCIKGLNKNRKEAISGFGTLHLFDDEKVMNLYLDHRQGIHEALIGMRSDQINQQIKDIHHLIHKKVPSPSLEMLSKLGHDLIQMLEEYLAKDEPDSYEIWKKKYESTIVALDEIRDVSDLFEQIANIYHSALISVKQVKTDRKHIDTSKIHTYIGHHYTEAISLDSIASHFYVTKEHLSRIYKAAYKMTINEQLTLYRMEKAKLLIQDEKLAIKDVAIIVGYQDLAYFYRVFKKYVGLAPGEYRKNPDIKNVQ